MISFFLNKKLNFLYPILFGYGIITIVLVIELRLIQDVGLEIILINPAIIIAIIILFGSNESGGHPDTIYHIIILAIFVNLIYWIPATFVTIKIIDNITDKFIRKKSKTAVP